jgi:uncharacterized membrane protein (DUF106 family)
MLETIENWMIANPRMSVILISVAVTFVMTLITKYFTDQKRMKELKELQKSCQIKLKDNKGDLKKQSEIQQEMMKCSMEMMKFSFKPMLITFIPILIFFGWFRGVYSSIEFSWFWWYLGTGIVSSIALRKIMNVA